jgi:hypothetical protein
MALADRFAERSVRGMILRAVGAWVLVGLPVIAARLWWSPAGAIAVFAVTVTVYVVAARRYIDQHRPQPGGQPLRPEPPPPGRGLRSRIRW